MPNLLSVHTALLVPPNRSPDLNQWNRCSFRASPLYRQLAAVIRSFCELRNETWGFRNVYDFLCRNFGSTQ